MWDAAGDLAAGIEAALGGLAGALAGADPRWLVLGVVLHLANQATRGRGWYAIPRSAPCPAPRLRKRDAIAAWVAGAGAGGVVSARGGDAVRVLVLARRMPGAGNRAILTGTLVAECVGETALGLVTLVLAIVLGIDAAPDGKIGLAVLAGLLLLTALALLGRRHARVQSFVARVRRGC